MQPSPLVSVIMPVHNASATVVAAVESIRRQTIEDWELIAVDDGSADDSGKLLASLAQSDKRIHLHSMPDNRGIVEALHLAMRHAHAPLIARMDADDISHPRRLELQAAHLQAHPVTGLVSCLVEHLGEGKHQHGYEAHVQWLNEQITHEQISAARFTESPLAHPSVMFRRSIWDAHGGYTSGDFPEDYELWLRWLQHGVRMEKVPEVLLVWRDHPGRLSRTHSMYRPEAFYELRAKHLGAYIRSDESLARKPIFIWGAGRLTRRRAEMLLHHGISISGFIDVDPAKIGREYDGSPVISPDSIPAPGNILIISYVSNRGIRDLIRQDLLARGHEEMKDFILAG